ncbi:phage tail sheath subtilisin-like domain-containing protein [uncultured Clostridium sp.]|uniref:phage tail sheath subtilisin-like domain-containing protein n=1 Tax=uncultured Clostridium sp. TaxID=59620 RepID=UPI0025DA82CE|nr:phage tail sheath subtilisin-like domain-containing protein [uncultured Clostridium sp.]
MGMPVEKIDLQALAENAGARSVRGIAMLILDDKVTGVHKYARKRNVKETYSAENKKIISKCFIKYNVKNMKIVCYDSTNEETLQTALDKINGIKFNYLACPTATSETDKKLVGDFIKEQRKQNNILVHAILNGYAGDDEGVINFPHTNITVDGEELTGAEYCVDVACMCATGAINKSMTNRQAQGVTAVSEIEDEDAAIDAGQLILTYDNDLEYFVFARGVNSKTTIAEGEKEQLKKIRIVEILDMIRDDAKLEWKANYKGKKENTFDERQNLCTKYNLYLNTLSRKKYLNNATEYKSYCEQNIEAMKNYLEDERGVDVSELADNEILTHDYGEHVFLKWHVYPVDVMEDLELIINY